MRWLLALLLVAGPAIAQQTLQVTHAASSFLLAGRPTPVAPRSLVRVSLVSVGNDSPGFEIDASQPMELTVQSGDGEPQSALILVRAFFSSVIAVIPEEMPLGPATLTASFNGGADEISAEIEIVSSDLRLFTIDSTFGPAVAHNVSANAAVEFNGLTTPALAEEYVTLWGSGLGHTPQEEVEVRLDGEPVPVEYAGPAPGAQGLDQINIFLPPEAGLTDGCYVPLAIVVGERESPFTTLSKAIAEGPCEHPLSLSAEQMARLDAGEPISVGSVELSHTIGPVPEPARLQEIQRFEQATAQFSGLGAGAVAQRSRGLDDERPTGCSIGPLGGVGAIIWVEGLLDAGPSLELRGPDGRVLSLEADELGRSYYQSRLDPSPATTDPEELPPPFLVGGSWELTVPGGEDVAPFSLAIPLTPPLELLNLSELETIDRSADLRVAWSPADYHSEQVVGLSVLARGAEGESFLTLTCRAPALAGEVVVPANLLGEFAAQEAFATPSPTLTLSVSRLAPVERRFTFPLANGEQAPGILDARSAITLPLTLQ